MPSIDVEQETRQFTADMLPFVDLVQRGDQEAGYDALLLTLSAMRDGLSVEAAVDAHDNATHLVQQLGRLSV